MLKVKKVDEELILNTNRKARLNNSNLDPNIKKEIMQLLHISNGLIISGIKFRNLIIKLTQLLNKEFKGNYITINKEDYEKIKDYIFKAFEISLLNNCNIFEYKNCYLFTFDYFINSKNKKIRYINEIQILK